MSDLRSGLCLPLPFPTSTQRRNIGGTDIISTLKLRIARTFIVGSHGVTERSFVGSPRGSEIGLVQQSAAEGVLTNLKTLFLPRFDLRGTVYCQRFTFFGQQLLA